MVPEKYSNRGCGGSAEYVTRDRVQPKGILNRTCYFSMERAAVLTLREQESTGPPQK